jgi:DNA polymerase I-like protein with 3'-5' exonuclease and polymerase domains
MMHLVFDIEANGLNEVVAGKKDTYLPEATKIWCMSVMDIDTKEIFLFEQDNMADGIEMLRHADLIIGHNIYGFDIPLIERLYGPLNKKPWDQVIDTLILSRLMYGDNPPTKDQSHSLMAWGEHLGEAKADYQGGWDQYTAEMGKYCLQDSIVTDKIWEHFGKQNYLSMYNRAARMEHVVADMIKRQVEAGFSFDIDKAEQLEMELLIEKSQIEDTMRKIFPDKIIIRHSEKTGKRLKDKVEVFNPGSRQQIAERLKEKYGWEAPTTDKGNPKVDHEVLSQLEYPETKTLCNYFDLIKLMGQVSDWVGRAHRSRDGRIHAYINTLGAVTGRMSSKEPNIQQVHSDPRARALFVPQKEWSLVGSDLKGLELRMLAHYLYPYDGGAYAKEVCEGDIHTHNQKAMELDSRNTAKTAIYCFLYGGGDEKFGKTIGCSVYKAKQTKNKLLSNIPGLKKLIENCRFDTLDKGYVKPFNWRPVFVRKEHAALNTLLQSSGAHIAKAWACVADQRLRLEIGEDRFNWVASVHDELQVECHPDVAHKVGKILCDSATTAGELLKCNCLIEAEYKIGSNWSETH